MRPLADSAPPAEKRVFNESMGSDLHAREQRARLEAHALAEYAVRPYDHARAKHTACTDLGTLVHHHVTPDLVRLIGRHLGELARRHEARKLQMRADRVQKGGAVGDLHPVSMQQHRVQLVCVGEHRQDLIHRNLAACGQTTED